jgi:ribosomal protein S18 acetylase RimI-like enzyme
VPEPGAPPPYSLRPATADDYPFLYDLHVAAMKDYVARTWGWDDAFQRKMFADKFRPEGSQVVVAGGRDVGVVERRPDAWFIANIEIAPAAQGRGLGAAIVLDLLATAARDGLPVRLQVLKVNPARRLYERLGFAITGETPTHYLMGTAPIAPEREGG